jgi:nucleoside-diphosphate kinase
MEDTLVLLKPDAVKRDIIGELIARFERTSLKLVGLKLLKVDEAFAAEHYPVTKEWAKGLGEKSRAAYAKRGIELKETDMEIATRVQGLLIDFLTSGPVVAMVLRGNAAVEIVRKIVGNTEPRQALPGTIRGDYSLDSYKWADEGKRSIHNMVHASGTVEEAKREIALWFRKA